MSSPKVPPGWVAAGAFVGVMLFLVFGVPVLIIIFVVAKILIAMLTTLTY